MNEKIIDAFGRKIEYLRISVTDKCNLRCSYCMPPEGIPKKTHVEMMRQDEIISIAQSFAELGVSKIRLTGGEPMVRKDIEGIIYGISEKASPKDFAMTTNGTLLKGRLKRLRELGLMRINISLDTLDPLKYASVTRDPKGAYGTTPADILDSIEEALEAGFKKVKINTVLIGGFNDVEIRDLVDLARTYPIDVRFIELMPIGEASGWAKSNFVPVHRVLEEADFLYPVTAEDPSSPARYFSGEGMKGRIGLINPVSCNFCSNCNRIRITPDGKLKTCLHGEEEYELLNTYRSGGPDALKELIKKSVLFKPQQHEMNSDMFIPIKRDMNRIGG